MPETTSFAPGMFNWLELETTDDQSALQFYTQLFDWTVKAIPVDENTVYNMLEKNGRTVGAVFKGPGGGAPSGDGTPSGGGAPPHWQVYVTVADADEAAKRASELGATIVGGPFDVMDAGRMAIIKDPQGAIICLWQAGANPGFGVTNEPNAPCWFELHARDMAAAKAFYPALLGWTMKGDDNKGVDNYVEWHLGKEGVGGVMPSPAPAGTPSYWMHYIMVEDPEAVAEKAKSLGGSVLMPPGDIPNVGRFAVLADREGAFFAIYKPQ
jgi:uncharacterized protein